MKCFILLASLLMMPTIQQNRGRDIDEAVLCITGASSLEDLNEEILDDFYALSSRPLNINTASEKRLVRSGLFSAYQAASLIDYRERNGDVMSVMELMLVDGFDEDFARSVSCFISFSPALSGTSDHLSWDSMSRTGVKIQNDKNLWNYSGKIKIEREGLWSFGAAAKSGYDDGKWPPEAVSATIAVYGESGKWSVYGGDFNTRFGQGLALWSGFSLSGAQSASSFARHPGGLSPAWTLSPSSVHRGLAGECSFGRLGVSGFYSPGSVSGVNATYLAKYGQIGATLLSSGISSADWRWSLGKTDIFGELSADWPRRTGACLFGLTYNIDYQICVSSVARYYPSEYDDSFSGPFRSASKGSDETGVSIGLDVKKLTVHADASFHPSKSTSQYKLVSKYSPSLTDSADMSFKMTSRYRPEDAYEWRTELRSEIRLHGTEGLLLGGNLTVCRCRRFSFLSFAECGYEHETGGRTVKAYLRFTAFAVDNWDDRIYVYERDVPGTFSVPAYYGRGCSLSAVASLKSAGRCSVNARFSRMEYPWMDEMKAGKSEIKLQLVWNL